MLGQDATSSLRSRAVHSGAWIGVGFGIQKVLQLGSNLILTRLLFPEAFGLMALATVFLVGLAMFSDIGLTPAVIRDPRGDDPEFLNTAWTIQVARGLLLCAIGVAIAYPISIIYRQPIMFPLLAVLSTTAAINGFMSIGMATAERRLDFRTITIVQFAGQVLSVGLLVTLAYFWRSVWALAVANVFSTATTVAIGYLILPRHSHRLTMDRDAAKSLIHFGRWILFSTLVTYLGGEGLKAIQGGLLSPAEFGVLAIAYTIAGIPNELAARLSSSLGLPVLAETYRNAPQAASSVLSALRKRTITISLLLFTGVIAVSEPAIKLLYDSRYHDAAKYIAVLCLSNAVSSIGLGYVSSILAIGRSSLYFYIMTITFVLRSIGLFAGFEFDGILGMLYGVALSNVLIFIGICLVSKRLNISNTFIDTASLIYTLFLALIYIYLA